jgi:hypothetical protein
MLPMVSAHSVIIKEIQMTKMAITTPINNHLWVRRQTLQEAEDPDAANDQQTRQQPLATRICQQA